MQAEIERSDINFKRFFLLFNLSWILVSLCSLIFSMIGALGDHPEYLHDWRGLTILILALCVPATFAKLLLIGRKHRREDASWPPPMAFALLIWGILYVNITLLNLLDNNFVWVYFTVLGITYSFFERRKMLFPVFLIFLSYLYFLDILKWPLTQSNWGAILGNGITFLSLTIVSITIQYLIGERFERRALMQRLTQANTDLEAAHNQLAENALQEQELAILRERTRLARDMHDTLGHSLVLVSVKLEAAQRLRELDPQRCDQELESTKEIIRSSMKELRASIANLRSPALEREPACRALSRYAREMAQRGDLRVSYDLHPDIEGLPEIIEDTLWKVGLEALTNIEKHAHARNVLLHMSRQNGQIFMQIADDGIGLPAHRCDDQQEHATSYQSPSGHYGLNGIQERVKNAQGQLHIHSNSQEGTTIEVTLPLVEAPSLAASSLAASEQTVISLHTSDETPCRVKKPA
ncbi:MAG TPA: sensor histidine kinase [Ktedonobacteraceae bacterium]|jgi:signal transduction histidine kinase